MSYDNDMKKYRDMIETGLQSIVDRYDEVPYGLRKAMSYSLMSGGKLIRPVMLLAACDAFGGDLEKALPFACAIEMIHVYSLIHDDLPGMDNDDLRRGRPTNHKVFGEGVAILAGDGLLTYAMEIMLAAVDDDRTREAMMVIVKAAGVRGMIAGQYADLESEGKQIDIDKLRYIHRNKTGALLKAPLVAGAILGGADEDQVLAVSEYGVNLGIAFQITDDLLDVIGDKDITGKNTGSDEASGKLTYVKAYGVEKSKQLALDYTNFAIASLDIADIEKDFLVELAESLSKRAK